MKTHCMVFAVHAIVLHLYNAKALDWQLIKADKVNKLRETVEKGFSHVKPIATNKNATVGDSIYAQINIFSTRIKEIANVSNTALDEQRLSIDQAEQLFEELITTLSRLGNHIRTELAQPNASSTDAANLSHAIFDDAYSKALKANQELYALLRSARVNWPASKAKALEIHEIFEKADTELKKVKTFPDKDDSSIREKILTILDPLSEKALTLIDNAKIAVECKNLTRVSAEDLFTELGITLKEAYLNLESAPQLTTNARKLIREIFEETYVKAELKIQEIYTILLSHP